MPRAGRKRMKGSRLLAVGGAHIDRRGQVSGIFVPQASNPGVLRETTGGAAFNAARNAVLRGVPVSLLSLRGGDPAGESVGRAIAAVGIADLSATFLDRTTPSYTALLDRQGEMIAGLADMALYDTGFEKQVARRACRDAVAAADAVLLDANLPEGAIARLAGQAAPKPVYAVAVSPAKALRLADALGRIACLFMTAREAAGLAGEPEGASATAAVEGLRLRGLAAGVITAGGRPVTGFDASGRFTIEPPAPERIADVTGAGDALAGATIAALMQGLPLREALRHGMAAAFLTIQTRCTVARVPRRAFAAALKRVPAAQVIGER